MKRWCRGLRRRIRATCQQTGFEIDAEIPCSTSIKELEIPPFTFFWGENAGRRRSFFLVCVPTRIRPVSVLPNKNLGHPAGTYRSFAANVGFHDIAAPYDGNIAEC